MSQKITPVNQAAGTLASDSVTTAKILGSNVTPAKLTPTGFKAYGFTGNNGAGAITLTGATVGDRVLALWQTDATTLASDALFETTITVINQIQQSSATDQSTHRFLVLLIPASS